MKKTTLTFSFILVFTLYAVLSTQKDASTQNDASAEPPKSRNISTVGTTVAMKSTASNSTVPPKTNGLYNDGTYTGDAADAYYGNVQIEATIKGGRLTNVRFLQHPNNRGTSIEINSQAMPYLKQEAIAAQSARVNVVSGATFTSEAFQSSLTNALTQARSTA
ncbi:MAG: FMN-binding protein [Minisyncoccota bacterium]